MATEYLSYSIPDGGYNNVGVNTEGSNVSLVITYDETSGSGGYYSITDITGNYTAIIPTSSGGITTASHTVTGKSQYDDADNLIYIGSDKPYVTANGISFTIDGDPADSDDGAGNVNFYNISDSAPFAYSQTNQNEMGTTNATESDMPCFASGTRVKTVSGDVLVENLSVGDHIVTASGEHRPVRWLGHRTIDCRNRPRSQEWPVRISAQAFGPNRPARDLVVSPGHALCFDVLGEVLIPAASLVNGTTIIQQQLDSVTYWHVELDSHDILLAENMPAESYLDMDNRAFFAESGVVALDASPDAKVLTHADFCRPFHAEGAVVAAIKAQTRVRAMELGWRYTNEVELHLEIDGCRLDPVVRGLTARFHVPADAEEVWLCAPSARPCDVYETGDDRDLGLFIGALRVEDGFAPRDIALDDPLLCIGFHPVEEGARRWTTGRAKLPAALWADCADDFFLRIDLATAPVPRWQAPAADQARLALAS